MILFGFIAGFLVGGMGGVIVMALLVMAGENERRIEREAVERGL